MDAAGRRLSRRVALDAGGRRPVGIEGRTVRAPKCRPVRTDVHQRRLWVGGVWRGAPAPLNANTGWNPRTSAAFRELKGAKRRERQRPTLTTRNPQPVTHNSGDTIRRDICGPCIAAGRAWMGVSVHDSSDKFGDDGFGPVLIPSPRGPTPPVPSTVVRAGLRPAADPLSGVQRHSSPLLRKKDAVPSPSVTGRCCESGLPRCVGVSTKARSEVSLSSRPVAMTVTRK